MQLTTMGNLKRTLKTYTLKSWDIGYTEATFLDLGIKILDNKFIYKLFGFPIVRMPYATNNMPSKIFYSTFMSELLRIVKYSLV